jgi:hypothetical protein
MTARTNTTAPEHRWGGPTGKFFVTREKLARACRSGSPKPQVYMIEGEQVTVAQIAAKFGMAESTASRRLLAARTRAKETGGKVTWEDFK